MQQKGKSTNKSRLILIKEYQISTLIAIIEFFQSHMINW